MKASRFENKASIVVCGAISPVDGPIHFMYGVRSFKSGDMLKMLREIRKLYKPKDKVAIFWDNARIHTANIVKEAI